MIWSEVQITTTTEAEDAVAEAFYEAGAGGVVIESANDVNGIWGDPLVGYIDDSLLQRPENTSIIRGYFPVDAKSDERIQKILLKIAHLPKFGLNPGSGELKIVEVEDQDWANSWKKYFVATHVTDDIVVVPSWQDYKPGKGEKIIMLDPGMAFGTGTHETTKLCAEMLEKYVTPESLVVDVGTGSGILAIIALMLGADKVVAIDLDPVALKVAEENLTKNSCREDVKLLEGNLLNGVILERPADVIIANILPGPVIELMPKARELLDDHGVFIASGIIQEALPEVIDALEENSFQIAKTAKMGEWRSVAAVKL